MRKYRMTWDKLSRIKKMKGIKDDEDLICHSANCNDPIKEGDDVVSVNSRCGTHIFHRNCLRRF